MRSGLAPFRGWLVGSRLLGLMALACLLAPAVASSQAGDMLAEAERLNRAIGMLGSVTEKVVRHGADPVLVVRGE